MLFPFASMLALSQALSIASIYSKFPHISSENSQEPHLLDHTRHLKRDGFLNASGAFEDTLDTVWNTFWSDPQDSFSSSALPCNSAFSYPSIWDLAVTAKAVAYSSYPSGTVKVTNNCLDYRNSAGWFSSSTAKDNDVYVDDNAQVLWVYLESYKHSGNGTHLQIAQTLMSLIQGQWVSKTGGVRWKLGAPYVAAISTSEAGLSAAKMYEYFKDPSLLQFAQQCTDWIFNNLQDPSDGLIYDGMNSDDGSINKGKLTYTVGVVLSTLALLNKYSANPSYLSKAVNLSDSALNPNGAFYTSDGYWNNPLDYSHLLFAGLTDLLLDSSSYAKEMYQSTFNHIQSEVLKQGAHIYNISQVSGTGNYVSVPDTPSSHKYLTNIPGINIPGQSKRDEDKQFYCAASVNNSLMEDSSAAQIYYQVSRLSPN